MVKEVCPRCNSDWIRNGVVFIKKGKPTYYKKCWACGRMFTRDLVFEMREIRNGKKYEKDLCSCGKEKGIEATTCRDCYRNKSSSKHKKK